MDIYSLGDESEFVFQPSELQLGDSPDLSV